VDPDRRGGSGTGTFGDAGVVAVSVSDQHGIQAVEPAAQGRQGADQQVPVARGTGVDQDQLATVLDQVEIADTTCQPVNAVGHLHVATSLPATILGWAAYP
jgi:hypothetical protein